MEIADTSKLNERPAAELQRENARMVRQLHRAHEELDHFVRALSHDMSANFMLLESSFAQLKKTLAGGRAGGAECAEGLSVQVAHVDACLCESKRFLDDLVCLARTGSVDMEPGRVDLTEVVDNVLFEQRELLARRDIKVVVRRPLPVVWCNAARAKQMVTNLLRNAALHGCDPQHPRITVAPAVAKVAEATGVTRTGLMIHDNGSGIDPQSARKIFLPGQRLPQAAADGSGMGLAIVRRIVDHLGGAVYVDPHHEAGTAFVVYLPEAEGQPDPGESSRHSEPPSRDRRRTLQADHVHAEPAEGVRRPRFSPQHVAG